MGGLTKKIANYNYAERKVRAGRNKSRKERVINGKIDKERRLIADVINDDEDGGGGIGISHVVRNIFEKGN